jgi:PKD repeat protein
LEWSFQQGGGASGGRGQAVQTVVMATDSRGRASMYWQLGTQAGNQSASVEITGYADIGPSGPAAAPPADRGWRKADFSARGHPSSPSNVSVSPSSVSLAVGDSVQLTGEVSDKYGNVMESPTITWSSTNKSVAETTNDGVVYSVAPGETSIIAESDGAVGTASVTTADTTTGNQAPTAWIASPSSDTTVVVGDAVPFSGGAGDTDGTIAAHAWAFGDGTTSSQADPGTHTYTGEGTFDVTYVVTDDGGLQSQPATRSISVVAAANELPVATIDSPADGTTVLVGEPVEFLGTASDPDGSVTSHRWTFGDGSTSSVEDPGTRTYAAAGTYNVTYRVWDDASARSQIASIDVVVEAPASNQSPTASISSPSSDVSVYAGDAVSFQGSASDPDGSVVTHLWDFGDGATAAVQNPGSHVFSTVGTYEVRYTVTDDDGAASAPALRTVTVRTPAPPPPGPGDEVFVADWDQGLGTGPTAFTDGGQFDEWGGGAGNGGFEVRSTSANGRDFSTPNYLSIQMVNGQDWIDMTSQNWATPQVGQTVTASWEMRWTSPVGGETTHGFYFDPDFDGENWGPPTLGLSIEDDQDNWQIGVWTSPSASPDLGEIRAAQRYPLSKAETYHVTLSYTRVSSDQFTVSIQVRDMGGNLILDSSDFADYEWYYGDRSLTETVFTQSGAGAQGMTGFRVGNNGLDVKASSNQPIAEIADLRISLSGN